MESKRKLNQKFLSFGELYKYMGFSINRSRRKRVLPWTGVASTTLCVCAQSKTENPLFA